MGHCERVLRVNPLAVLLAPSTVDHPPSKPAEGSGHIWAERLTNGPEPSPEARRGPSRQPYVWRLGSAELGSVQPGMRALLWPFSHW